MKDNFKELPHDQVFDKFFNQNEGVAGLCRQIMSESLCDFSDDCVDTKADNCGYVATVLFSNDELLGYDTYNTKEGKPYAVEINFYTKDGARLHVVVRTNEVGQLQVSGRFYNVRDYEDGNTMVYSENYDEIHFSDKLFMFDHYVCYQSFPTAIKTKEEALKVRNGAALTRDFNIVKQGKRITRFYDATKVYRERVFPRDYDTYHEKANLVKQLVEKLGKKQTAFYNGYEVADESMNYYIAKNRKLFDEFPRDARPFEDVVKYPPMDGSLPINGMM